MTNLFFGMLRESGVPADENTVRANTYVVSNDTPAAEAKGAPDFNELETDPNPALGMVGRQVASDWHAREKAAPFWQALVDNQDKHNQIIDHQVSTSGTAAAREAAGEFGHGTMEYAVGIEPTQGLVDGNSFGNDYFVTNPKDIQDTAGNYMTPASNLSHDETAAIAAYGKQASHDANAASVSAALYSQFLGA